MAYGGSNDDVIDDVMWPWKVKVVIPISLRPVISYKIHLADICTLWAPSSSYCFYSIFRSSPERWPNKPGKNVHPSVHTSVRTSEHMSVRTYIHTSTITHNAATNQIVVFVKVNETFMTIWLSRLSKVRVKVTWDLKFQKWQFSKSISSAIFQPIKKIPIVCDTRPKYLKSLRLDFWISS